MTARVINAFLLHLGQQNVAVFEFICPPGYFVNVNVVIRKESKITFSSGGKLQTNIVLNLNVISNV